MVYTCIYSQISFLNFSFLIYITTETNQVSEKNIMKKNEKKTFTN